MPGATRRDPAGSAAGLWDRVVALAERLEPADWSRPTPDADLTVRDVVEHVAGPSAPGPGASLLVRLRRAREMGVAVGIEPARGSTRNGPSHLVLGAACLDLYVHLHDLTMATDAPVDLEERSAEVEDASRQALRYAPYLFAAAGAADGQTLSLRLQGVPALDAGLAVRGGRGVWVPGEDRADGVVTATPAALILLLAGRADPRALRRRGTLEWSGAAGDTFVHRARLFPVSAERGRQLRGSTH
jgi:hypothetical protein